MRTRHLEAPAPRYSSHSALRATQQEFNDIERATGLKQYALAKWLGIGVTTAGKYSRGFAVVPDAVLDRGWRIVEALERFQEEGRPVARPWHVEKFGDAVDTRVHRSGMNHRPIPSVIVNGQRYVLEGDED